MEKESNTYKRIKSVAKAAEIMIFLSDKREPVPAPRMAEELGLPYPTVMTILSTLADHDFVRQTSDGYVLGMMLAVFWARKKAQLEAQRDLLNARLAQLEVSDVG